MDKTLRLLQNAIQSDGEYSCSLTEPVDILWNLYHGSAERFDNMVEIIKEQNMVNRKPSLVFASNGLLEACKTVVARFENVALQGESLEDLIKQGALKELQQAIRKAEAQ